MYTAGKVGAHLLLPLVVFLVPTAWIERRRPLCLIRTLFGIRCPGCGMTRAVSCAAHGHFRDALRYNRLVAIVLPLLVYEWARSLQRAWQDFHRSPNAREGFALP